MLINEPNLFGFNVRNCNRDFSKETSWGKNQFNSSFPISLTLYLDKLGFDCVYLTATNQLEIQKKYISPKQLIGTSSNFEDIFYSFESQYESYEKITEGRLPRVDFVSRNLDSSVGIQPLEIKLTAIPDNTTYKLDESKYGAELVVRPDTIVYLACSLAKKLPVNSELNKLFHPRVLEILNWDDGQIIRPLIPIILDNLKIILSLIAPLQTPLLLQPIWKTKGKAPVLADNCLDVFVWSDIAFAKMFIDVASVDRTTDYKITRQMRTAVWLLKMLHSYMFSGKIDHESIIDGLSYNTKNDKAFALSGAVTRKFMDSDELKQPRVHKSHIKEIILNGGQNFLSPERRFDAIICSSPDLFY